MSLSVDVPLAVALIFISFTVWISVFSQKIQQTHKAWFKYILEVCLSCPSIQMSDNSQLMFIKSRVKCETMFPPVCLHRKTNWKQTIFLSGELKSLNDPKSGQMASGQLWNKMLLDGSKVPQHKHIKKRMTDPLLTHRDSKREQCVNRSAISLDLMMSHQTFPPIKSEYCITTVQCVWQKSAISQRAHSLASRNRKVSAR